MNEKVKRPSWVRMVVSPVIGAAAPGRRWAARRAICLVTSYEWRLVTDVKLWALRTVKFGEAWIVV